MATLGSHDFVGEIGILCEVPRTAEVRAGKAALLSVVRSVQPEDMMCSYVRQPRALGLGHAVLCAQHLVGEHPFAVLLADDLMVGEPGGPGIMQQMVQVHAQTGASVLAVQEVPLDQVSRYGIIAGPSTAQGCTRVERMVEKPQPAQAPSRLAVAGRYILSPAVFECIRQGGRGVGGEIQLTDGIAGLLHSETVLGYNYRGKRYDCGSKLGFLEATVELALQHAEVGPGFSQWLKQAGLGR